MSDCIHRLVRAVISEEGNHVECADCHERLDNIGLVVQATPPAGEVPGLREAIDAIRVMVLKNGQEIQEAFPELISSLENARQVAAGQVEHQCTVCGAINNERVTVEAAGQGVRGDAVPPGFVDSVYTILGNMAKENAPKIGFAWQRWPINHELLRADAKAFLERYPRETLSSQAAESAVDLDEWHFDKDDTPPYLVEVEAVIKGCETGRTRRAFLKHTVDGWMFDGEKLSYAWDVIAWANPRAVPDASKGLINAGGKENPDPLAGTPDGLVG